jgi:MFS family permease
MCIVISVLGFGFSKSFYQAMFFRTVGGALNGNVGVMRTMISEIVREKKWGFLSPSFRLPFAFLAITNTNFRYQSRAFLLLPMTFNVGVIIGPILGGLLADPAGSYPKLFGNITWLKKYPYAAPNILSACFLFCAMGGIFFGLEEVFDLIAPHYIQTNFIRPWNPSGTKKTSE